MNQTHKITGSKIKPRDRKTGRFTKRMSIVDMMKPMEDEYNFLQLKLQMLQQGQIELSQLIETQNET